MRTARRHRTITIQAGEQTLTAADPILDDLAQALSETHASGAHQPDKSRESTRSKLCQDFSKAMQSPLRTCVQQRLLQLGRLLVG